eukprot:3515150-Ditylum_brightwellii.AAC.1
MDDLQALLNSTSPGGVKTVLTGHAHQLPKLSAYFGSTGESAEALRKNDPHLTSISCTPDFGEYAKLIPNCMPPQECHSFVGMCQLDTVYKHDKIELNTFNVISSQHNSPCGGEGHEHDGFPASLVNTIVARNLLLAMQHVLLKG